MSLQKCKCDSCEYGEGCDDGTYCMTCGIKDTTFIHTPSNDTECKSCYDKRQKEVYKNFLLQEDDRLTCICGLTSAMVEMRNTEDGYMEMCDDCYHQYGVKKMAQYKAEQEQDEKPKKKIITKLKTK